jgi:Ni/Fe-hydrogenase subunit HybB-like protein
LGLAGLGVVTVFVRYRLGPSLITPSHLFDLGRLLLGFNLTYLAMAWSQYIVIWYGNIPEETHFIILRLWEAPWAFFAWGGLVLSVLIPFVVFLSQSAKRVPRVMLAISVSIAVGLWLERYVLVAPSLWRGQGIPLGWVELGITLGFFSASGLSYLFFLRHFPVIPFAQSLSAAAVERQDVERTA